MIVKQIAKHYSKASKGRFVVRVKNGVHSFSFEAVEDMIERDAPLFRMTVGLIYVEGDDLVVTAYDR